MSILKPLGVRPKWLRAGFFGPEKSGKTRTGIDLLLGLLNYLKLQGPVVMFDSEGGSDYIGDYARDQFGRDLVGIKSESFADLIACAREAVDIGAVGFFADSITHPSIEVRSSYLKGVNEVRQAKNLPSRKSEIQDVEPIRGKWKPWVDWYKNAPMHVVICGRKQNEWSWEVDEETDKKKLVQTGTKMNAQNEFGYEPSLLIEMARIQVMNGGDKEIAHRATVLADRFPGSNLTGKVFDDPTWESWMPHILRLDGALTTVDTAIKTDHEVGDDGNADWIREKHERVFLCEEIGGELLRAWPGATKEEKVSKAEAVEAAFGTRSWSKVEHMDSQTLKAGLEMIRERVRTAIGSNFSEAGGE